MSHGIVTFNLFPSVVPYTLRFNLPVAPGYWASKAPIGRPGVVGVLDSEGSFEESGFFQCFSTDGFLLGFKAVVFLSGFRVNPKP